MSGKQIVSFGDICREVKITTKDPIADGYDRYIGLEHLDSGSLKIKRWGQTIEDNPGFTRVFKKGHILFGKRRPYLKKAAIAEFDGICSGDIIVLEKSKKDLIDKDLLPFVIQSSRFWDWAIKTSSGSLSPRTKFSALSELKISLLEKDEQLQLKAIIKSKENTLDRIKNLLSSSNTLMRVLLQDFVCANASEKNIKQDIPKGWSLKKLSDVADYQLGKVFPSTAYCGSGIKLLRPGNLYCSGIVGWSNSDTTYLPLEYEANSSAYIVKADEIVMNLTAQSLDDGFLGRVCMTKNGEHCLLNQRLARISPREKIHKNYLFWALQSRLAREHLHRMPVGTKVKHLYNFEIESIPILVPNDYAEQIKISEIMNTLSKTILDLNAKLEKVSQFSLLHDRLLMD